MSQQNDHERNVFGVICHSMLGAACLWLTKVFIEEDKKNEEEIKTVKRAFHNIKEYEPDELIQKLDGLYKKTRSDQKYIDCGKFFVKGVISCDQPIHSFKDSNIKLVYSNLKKFDLVATVSEKKVLNHSRNFKSQQQQYASMFELKPTIQGKSNNGICFVENIKNARLGDVVHFVASDEQSLFPAINMATLGVGSVIKIGLDQNEFGIKVGDHITVYGRVLYNQIEKIIKFDNPQNILNSKAEYEKYISEFSFASFAIVLFGGLTVIECYNLFNSIYQLISNKSDKKK